MMGAKPSKGTPADRRLKANRLAKGEAGLPALARRVEKMTPKRK